jgi:hypothetical protein
MKYDYPARLFHSPDEVHILHQRNMTVSADPVKYIPADKNTLIAVREFKCATPEFDPLFHEPVFCLRVVDFESEGAAGDCFIVKSGDNILRPPSLENRIGMKKKKYLSACGQSPPVHLHAPAAVSLYYIYFSVCLDCFECSVPASAVNNNNLTNTFFLPDVFYASPDMTFFIPCGNYHRDQINAYPVKKNPFKIIRQKKSPLC